MKSPRSLSGRSIHVTLAPNGHGHVHEWPTTTPFVQYQSALPIWDTAIQKIWPWKSMVKVMCVVKGQGRVWPSKFKVKVMVKVKPIGHICGLEFNRYVCFSFRGNRTTFGWGIGNSLFDLETSRSRLWPRSNLMVTFGALEFNRYVCFSFRGNWLRYQFYIWPWKFKSKVMAKIKPDSHIWALEFNQYVCFSFLGNQIIWGWDIANSIFDLENSSFSFRGNRIIFSWDIANSIFDLETSRSRSRRKSTKI